MHLNRLHTELFDLFLFLDLIVPVILLLLAAHLYHMINFISLYKDKTVIRLATSRKRKKKRQISLHCHFPYTRALQEQEINKKI